MTNEESITLEDLNDVCVLCGESLVPRDWKPENALHIVCRITFRLTDESGKVLTRGPDDPAEYIVHRACARKMEKGS